MNSLTRLLILGLLVCTYPIAASAQPSLGLNFAATDPDAPTSSLNAGDVAGVVPQANWNSLAGATGSAAAGTIVYDNGGASTASGVSVTWASPNTWRSGANSAFPAGPNRVLMSGYLDSNDTAPGGVMLAINGIDAALRSPAYDVYVYLLGDSGENRGGGYTINDGATTILKYGSTLSMPTTFVEDPGTDADNSADGTHLVFRGLTGASFTLASDATLTTPPGFRAPINGIQIVAVPEPAAATLAGVGVALLAAARRLRRRN